MTPSRVALALAAFALTGTAHATPMSLTITAQDLTTLQTFSQTFTDASTLNLISPGTITLGAMIFQNEQANATVGAVNSLITDALTVTDTSSTDPYRLTKTLTGMNFTGPTTFVSLTGSGTWLNSPGSQMSLSFYDDPTNQGLNGTAQLVGAFTSPVALNPTSSYSYSPGTTPLSIPDTGLFSMTENWTYTIAAGGELVSRGQTETKTLTPTSVTEPASLSTFIIALGLLALGAQGRRKSRRT